MFGQKGDEGARGFPGPPGPIGLQVSRFSGADKSKLRTYACKLFAVILCSTVGNPFPLILFVSGKQLPAAARA